MPTPPVSHHSLHRRSLASQIAEHLREEIVLGRLTPETPISQKLLGDQYGTSRMPVRDAVVKLTGEGLIDTTAGGRAVVARLTPADIVDVFLIEGIVHGRAAHRAVGLAGPDDVAELARLHERMVDAERSGDLTEMPELNWRFHKRINLLSGSPKLIAILRAVSLNLPREFLLEIPDWVARTNAGHTEILSAFAARDAERAEALCSSHVAEVGETLAGFLTAQGAFAGR